MPFGKKKSLSLRKELKSKILELMVSAVPDKDIMNLLNIPRTTYYRYADEIANELYIEYTGKENRIISGYINRTLERIKNCRINFSKTPDPRWLAEERQNERDLIVTLQSIGAMKKETEKPEDINYTVKWVDPKESK